MFFVGIASYVHLQIATAPFIYTTISTYPSFVIASRPSMVLDKPREEYQLEIVKSIALDGDGQL